MSSVDYSGKMRALAQLLQRWKRKGRHKVLLFSRFTRVLDVMEVWVVCLCVVSMGRVVWFHGSRRAQYVAV